MGQLYQFRCNACGYSAEVSGGMDAGESLVVETIHCEDCGALFDAVITRTPDDESSYCAPACPVNANHPVRPWVHPGPCPKCGGRMGRDEHCLLWD